MRTPSPLRIGRTADGDPFELPVELVTQTTAVIGIRGSGKTVTATVIAEELLARGQQVVIVDPTDVWWGLKSSADGRTAGFPVVILGGPHGDLPLAPESGAAVADFAVEQRVPLILSLRHLRKHRQREFVTAFAEQLYHRKGETAHRVPLLVVIDEASTFVPQKVQGDTARMVGAIEDLVRKGRAAGIGVLLVDQRPASVNKDVLTQLEVLVAHQITSPQDRKALDEWIRQHDAEGHRDLFLEQLAALPRGAAWFWSPSLDVFDRVQVRMRQTFDSSKTPKLGEVLEAPKAWAEVDLAQLRAQLDQAVAQAVANDPKTLKARIAELERELRAARKGAPDPEAVQRAVDRALQEAANRHQLELRRVEIDTRRELRDEMQKLEYALRAAEQREARTAELLHKIGRMLEQAVGVLRNGSAPALPAASDFPLGKSEARERSAPAPRPRPEPRQPATPRADESAETQVGGTPQRMLDAMALLERLGIREPTRESVAGFCTISANTGTFRTYLSQLRRAGLIEDVPGMRVRLTDVGRAAATPPPTIPSLEELHRIWLGKTGGTPARMLEAVIARYPQPVSREELAAEVGISHDTGTFRTYLSQLRRPGLIRDVDRGGDVVATELLFPEGIDG